MSIVRPGSFLILAIIALCHDQIVLAQGQHPASYLEFKTELSDARTADGFLGTFREMMSAIRGGMHVPDSAVGLIVAIAREKGYTEKVLPEVYGWAGSMFGNGRMEEAIIYFMESAEGYRALNKHFAEALSYFEIALVQHRAENLDEAAEYYHKAMNTGGDSLDNRTRINCINGIALINRQREDYPAADREFRNALHIARASGDTTWLGILHGNIGSLHLRKKQWDSSLFYYRKNMGFVRGTSEIENEIETYGHLAETMIGMKKYRTALQYLDSAMQVIRDKKAVFNDFFNPMWYIHESYAYAFAGLGDHSRAYDHLLDFHHLASERMQKSKGRSLKQLQLSYSFRQKQKEVDLLNEVNKANTTVIRQQRFVEIAFIAITILLSAIVIIGIRTNRQRHRMNRELTESNSELARLNNVKDKLFSVISHDLRGPLGNLQHLLNMISSGTLTHEQFVEISGKLGHQIKASGNALENLLYWAKSQLNETVTEKDRVSLGETVEDILLDFQGNFAEKALVAENQINAGLVAIADRAQIAIALRNIVGNAIKFSRPGGRISVYGERKGNQVMLNIADQGVGMTEEQVALFREGKHFTSPGTKMEKGTGIGLIIISEMIKQNGGKLNLESSTSSGTVITITLPAAN